MPRGQTPSDANPKSAGGMLEVPLGAYCDGERTTAESEDGANRAWEDRRETTILTTFQQSTGGGIQKVVQFRQSIDMKGHSPVEQHKATWP